MKTKYLAVSLVFGLMPCLPTAQAVVPPPAGGYPGFTRAEGTNALNNLTTGSAKHRSWLVFAVFGYHGELYNTGLAPERSPSIKMTPTPQSARRRFCSIRRALKTRPLELPRSYITTPPSKTRALEPSHFPTTSAATAIQPMERMHCLATPAVY